jgi:hypothetical protein
MDERPPESPESPEPAQTDDLEYDLAHEEVEGAGRATDAGRPEKEAESVYVATETSDYDGDYEYDLAHDVPGRSGTHGPSSR